MLSGWVEEDMIGFVGLIVWFDCLVCCVIFAFANEKIEVGRYRPLTPIKVFQFFEKIDENE